MRHFLQLAVGAILIAVAVKAVMEIVGADYPSVKHAAKWFRGEPGARENMVKGVHKGAGGVALGILAAMVWSALYSVGFWE